MDVKETKIKLYNSLTNKVEEFKPIEENKLNMYVCGSTVYNDMHIGNSRPIVFFDVVARFFKYLGYNVKFVSNFTDIDDKIIKKASEEGVDESVISERYIASIKETYGLLHCLPHYKNPKVTENIDNIIDFIDRLVKSGAAYVSGDDVYFDISKAKDYGILSGQKVEDLISGARIEENANKKNPADFTLWKKTEVGKNWDSPWGKGRPGWHTECVVMINNILGKKIDIHGGGLDLKFPHHDNEIAQSTVLNDNFIASYWMHNGRIDMNGVKMSKSLGNTIDAKSLVKEIGYGPYRLLILYVPYRQPLNFRDELLGQVISDYERITKAFTVLVRKLQIEKGITDYKTDVKNSELVSLKQEFIGELANDFNTANAITVLFKMVKLANVLYRQKEYDCEYAKELLTLFGEMLWVLGIDFDVTPLTCEELEIVRKWNTARLNKDFETADKYRAIITEKNIII